MDYFQASWFSQGAKKFRTEYISLGKYPIFFSTEGDGRYSYQAHRSLGGDIHAVFEVFFSNVLSKEIHVMNMSLVASEKKNEEYIFGQFEIAIGEKNI